jgi:hypothetical protein
MNNEFITGTPSLEDSNILWKRFDNEINVTSGEYEEAIDSLREFIWYWCPMSEGLQKGYCYIRGDYYRDRTLYVELYLPELLNINFLKYIQEWIINYSDEVNWRILIPTYLTDAEAVLVYSDKISVGNKYKHIDINITCEEIVKKMRNNDTHDTYMPVISSEKGVIEPNCGIAPKRPFS